MGTIARVFTRKGTVFILTEGARRSIFTVMALDGLSFEEIRKGLPVAFELVGRRKGPQAARAPRGRR